MTSELSAQQPSFNLEPQGTLLVLAEQTPEALGLAGDAVAAPLLTDPETLREQTGIEGVGQWDAIAADIRRAAGHDVALRAKRVMERGGRIHDMAVGDAQAMAERGVTNEQLGGFMQYAKAATDYLESQRPGYRTPMAFDHGGHTFVATRESVRGYSAYKLRSLTSGRVIRFNDRGPNQAMRGLHEDVEPLELAEFAGFIDRGDPVVALSRDVAAPVTLSVADATRADRLLAYDRQLLTGDNYTVAVCSLSDTYSLAGHIKKYGDRQGMLARVKGQITTPEQVHVTDLRGREDLEAIATMPDVLRATAHNSIGALTIAIDERAPDSRHNRELADRLIETALREDDAPATQEAALLVGKFDQRDGALRECMYRLVAAQYNTLAADERAQAAFVARVERVAPAFAANVLAAYAAAGIQPSEPTLHALLAEQDALNDALELRGTVAVLKSTVRNTTAYHFESGVAPEPETVEKAIEALAAVVQNGEYAVSAAGRQALAAAGVGNPELFKIALERVRNDEDGMTPHIALGMLVRSLFGNGSALRIKRERAVARERAEALASVQEIIEPAAHDFLKTVLDSASQYVTRPAEAAAATLNTIREAHSAALEQTGDVPPPVRTRDDVTRLLVAHYSRSLTELVRSSVVIATEVDGNSIRLRLDPAVMATHAYQGHPGGGLPWPGKMFQINDQRYVYNSKGLFETSYDGFKIEDPDGEQPTVVVTLI